MFSTEARIAPAPIPLNTPSGSTDNKSSADHPLTIKVTPIGQHGDRPGNIPAAVTAPAQNLGNATAALQNNRAAHDEDLRGARGAFTALGAFALCSTLIWAGKQLITKDESTSGDKITGSVLIAFGGLADCFVGYACVRLHAYNRRQDINRANHPGA